MDILTVVLIAFMVLVLGLALTDWASDAETIDDEEKKDIEQASQNERDSSMGPDEEAEARKNFKNIRI